MTVIKDGTGTGFLAKVDDENFLHTSARTFSMATYVSANNELVFAVTGTTTIPAGAAVEKTILVLINNATSTQTIAIQSVIASIQGDPGQPATFKAYLGKRTYSSGGTLVTPTNLNAGSPNTLDVTVAADNPTLGGTDTFFAQVFFELTLTGEFVINGLIILPPSGSLRGTVTGSGAATGGKIASIVIEYFAIDTLSIS